MIIEEIQIIVVITTKDTYKSSIWKALNYNRPLLIHPRQRKGQESWER